MDRSGPQAVDFSAVIGDDRTRVLGGEQLFGAQQTTMLKDMSELTVMLRNNCGIRRATRKDAPEPKPIAK